MDEIEAQVELVPKVPMLTAGDDEKVASAAKEEAVVDDPEAEGADLRRKIDITAFQKMVSLAEHDLSSL